ncbi:MAG: putative 2OG-Fe(II) oxygenase [Gammaproteobacteria bacterium]|jgi:uncharacterized protein (TIGR02466 family)
MITVTDLFTTAMAEASMPDHEALCDELTALFLRRESEDDGVRNDTQRATQFGALFESRFDLFRWPDPPVKKLAHFCHGSLVQLIRQLSSFTDEEFARLRFDYHAWFHVTRKGGYQGLHNHQNASWSGIFCVDPGDSPADRPDSGLVRFHDPRFCSWYHSEAGNLGLRMPYQHGGYDVSHRAGTLVMFPSFMMHEIFPYQGERPRIVVAFNCSVN